MKKNNSSIVTNVSVWFVKNSRASALILVSVLFAGIISYNSLLQREGFPAVEFPIVAVQANYFINSSEKVDSKVIQKIEKIASQIDGVESYSSTSSKNGGSVVFQFSTGVSAQTGADLINEELDLIKLPKESSIFVTPINVGSADGENDFTFAVANPDLKLKQLFNQAQKIKKELEDVSGIDEVVVKDQFETRINPENGNSLRKRVSFGRVGYVEDDKLMFTQAVEIGIKKDKALDAVSLSSAVRTVIEAAIDDDVVNDDNIYVYSGDIAPSIDSQISSLEASTVSALLVIVLVVFLLISWRAALISVLFLPVVLASVFFTLYVLGQSLNVISLFALILVIGLLVDDIIVVVEAIDAEKKTGLKGISAIKSALNKVALADFLGTLTTVTVFVPMLMIGGVLGEFISLIPITVIITLIISLLMALSVFTWLSSLLIEDSQAKPQLSMLGNFSQNISNRVEAVSNALGRFVMSYLNNHIAPFIVAGISLSVVLLLIFGGASTAEFDVFPSAKDSNILNVSVKFDDDLSLGKAQKLTKSIEEEYLNYEDIIETASYSGGLRDGGATASGYDVKLELVDMGDRQLTSPQLAAELNEEFSDFKQAEVTVGVVSSGPPSPEYQFQMQLYAEDKSDLRTGSRAIKNFIEDYEYEVNNDTIEVKEVVQSNINNINKFEGDRYLQISVKFDKEDVSSEVLQDLEKGIVNEFDEDSLDELGLDSESLGFDLGIETDNAESFRDAGVAFVVSLVIMYGILVALFNSFTQPLLVFVAIPFALSGALPGLVITNNPLSFFVFIGIIALAGIVVNNTIILVDYFNQLRNSGMEIRDSIVEAVKSRFRPLITTSITTVVGLVPLAFSDPFWESLAFTIIFGLISSTALVLTVFPAFMYVVEVTRDYAKKVLAELQ